MKSSKSNCGEYLSKQTICFQNYFQNYRVTIRTKQKVWRMLMLDDLNQMSKQKKPEVCIDAVKEIVKKFKTQGFQNLTHHELAVALSVIGFQQACTQFGASWTSENQQQALKILQKSEYDLGWFGKPNKTLYASIIPLSVRGDIEKIKELICTVGKDMKPELITTVDNFKRTALHLAVKEGFDILAEYLIHQGFSVTARDRELKTPLHYCKSQLVCHILLKNKASVIAKDNKNCTPVHYAASSPSSRMLEALLKVTNAANEADSTMKTPIFYSIFNTGEDQLNIIRVLLQNGAKVNDKDLHGKTPLHYAVELGKSKIIPYLLQRGASIDVRDKHNKTPLDLVPNQKIRKILTVYAQNKGLVSEKEEKQKRQDYKRIQKDTEKASSKQSKVNAQIYTKDLNQVSTWVREKFFVLMKKLQEAGVKSLWHVKRPYIYTGSWAQDIDGLEDLYDSFLNISGPEAAMRSFNILCPYEKPLPTVLGKSEQAFQSFFGENWFSTDPIEKVKNMHSSAKIRSELELKVKENQNLQSELMGYRAELEKYEAMIGVQKEELSKYQKIEEELRKERSKNTQQYSEILQHMGEKQDLKRQIAAMLEGQEKTKILSNLIAELRSKNESLMAEMDAMRINQAAARRKCGSIFLKSLALAQRGEADFNADENNLYDDDAIISLYQLLKNNPPNLQKRFRQADARGQNKLTIDGFTKMLEQLSMLPQDVMSMHRITGFSFGRKTLSLEQFKTILESRHRNRPMWEKKLIKKMKEIILKNNLTLERFFALIDKDGSGTIEASQLRRGLEDHNIFMNQNDWSNLFSLLDSDKSGEIDLEELRTLFHQEETGKLKLMDEKQEQQQEDSKIEEEQDQKEEYEEPSKEDSQHNQEKGEQQQGGETEQKQNAAEKQQEKMYEVDPLLQPEQPEEQEFKEEYEEKEEEEEGVIRLNGIIKAQIPKVKFPEGMPDHIYVQFTVGDLETVKMVDLTAPKLEIAIEMELIEYKIFGHDDLGMQITFFTTRQFDEENYLGEVEIGLGSILNAPQTWAINQKFKLEADDYDKEVKGLLILQVKYVPKKQEDE